MQMVEADVESVEARLRAGEIACVGCGGELRPWGYARWRMLRDHGRLVGLRPRRSRCRSCQVSHVLLPTLVLLRRVDLVAVIGAALVGRHVERRTRAEVSRAAGAPWDTVRGWLRRFGERAVVSMATTFWRVRRHRPPFRVRSSSVRRVRRRPSDHSLITSGIGVAIEPCATGSRRRGLA
jgi:hypothetical protein